MTDGNTEETPAEFLLVRSTIHLPEIGMGAVGTVDPRIPYIAGCLERGFLVPIGEPPTAEVTDQSEVDRGDDSEADAGDAD